jgi:TldD protein
MIEILKKMIGNLNADYFDLRYETKLTERIAMNKKEVRAFEQNTGDGYVLRVMKNGGFASVCFTKPEQAPLAIRKALENAEVLSRNQTVPKVIAKAPKVVAELKANLLLDPREVALEEKLTLVRHYSDLLFEQPKVANVEIGYADVIRNKFFINSEGSEINEELVTTRLAGSVITQEGNLTQTVRVAFGGSNGYQKVLSREADALERAKIGADLLKAEPVKGGTYKMVLNSSMAGVFTMRLSVISPKRTSCATCLPCVKKCR